MTLRTVLGTLELPPIYGKTGSVTVSQTAINLTDESISFVGQIYLEGGSEGGSKTISSAGGKIHWRSGVSANTFANAGTTMRVGIQDLNNTTGPARGDGTFDVNADLIGGTDSIATNTVITTAMTSGTKTIAHGDSIAIRLDLISRAGSDNVNVGRSSHPYTGAPGGSSNFPAYMFHASSASSSRQGGQPLAVIEFDDGTIGWLEGSTFFEGSGQTDFNVNTAGADEYGNFIQLPVPVRVKGIAINYVVFSYAADFELLIYSDPLGTPIVAGTISVDATHIGSTSTGLSYYMFATPVSLKANTPYAVTLRPTTTNNGRLYQIDQTSKEHFKVVGLDGDTCYSVKRLDNTGAFVDNNGGTAQTRRMELTVVVDQVNDNAGRSATHVGI